jgi:hypothetical protein
MSLPLRGEIQEAQLQKFSPGHVLTPNLFEPLPLCIRAHGVPYSVLVLDRLVVITPS